MKKTLEQIIKELETFSTNHKQINDFGFGDISNISTKDHNFPMMWVQPTPSVIGKMIELNLDIYIIDLLKQDRSNLLSIMSDTLLIGNDIISEYFDSEDDFEFVVEETAVDATPFEGEFDDFTAGFLFNIQVQIAHDYSKCEVPN